MNKVMLRKRIVRRLRKMRRDLHDTIAMKESWNRNRVEEMPFDGGFDKTLLHYVEKQLEAWAQDDRQAIQQWGDRMASMAERERHGDTSHEI